MYGTVADMVLRFGETELIRLSSPDGDLQEAIVSERVELALSDATALADSYLRKRYRVPLAPPPEAIVRAICILARFDLAHGEQREPTEQMRLARKEVLEWLAKLAEGSAELSGAVPITAVTGARVKDRPPVFSGRSMRDW